MEKWLDISGYEGYYEVSNKGNIRSLVGWNGHKYVKRIKLLSPYKQKVSKNSDYQRYVVKLTKKRNKRDFKVHRLVASAFIPKIEGKDDINHIDGDPLNNNVNNLEWCTQQENVQHAIDTGLKKIKNIPKGTLEKLYIKEGKTLREIGEVFNVSHTLIDARLDKYNISRRTSSESKIKYNLSKEFILKELKTKSQKQVAEKVGCDPSLISYYYTKIKNGDDLYQ